MADEKGDAEQNRVFQKLLNEILNLLGKKVTLALKYACFSAGMKKKEDKEEFLRSLSREQFCFVLFLHGLINRDLVLCGMMTELLSTIRRDRPLLHLPELEIWARRTFTLTPLLMLKALNYSAKVRRARLFQTPKGIYRILAGCVDRVLVRESVRVSLLQSQDIPQTRLNQAAVGPMANTIEALQNEETGSVRTEVPGEQNEGVCKESTNITDEGNIHTPVLSLEVEVYIMGLRNKIWKRIVLRSYSGPEKIVNNFIKRCTTSMSCSPAPPNSEVLKVAIIGSPNAGKSTIINRIVGRKVFAVSKKVHTTKSCAQAVYNEETKQIIFLDTPGLITLKEFEKYKLNRTFLQGGEDAIIEADIIGVVHDLSNPITRYSLDPKILRLLYLYNEKDSFLILNKIDTLKSKRQLLEVSHKLTSGKLKTDPCGGRNIGRLSEIQIKTAIEKKKQWEHFSDVFMMSALLGTGVNDLRNYLLMKTYPGHWIYPGTVYTDKDPVHIIEEAVRSRLLEHLPQEIPYSLDVQLEYLDMDNKDSITAVVLVCCNSERQERLVKGIRGERIKVIATEAEQDLADAFLSDMHLKVVITKKQSGNEISDFA